MQKEVGWGVPELPCLPPTHRDMVNHIQEVFCTCFFELCQWQTRKLWESKNTGFWFRIQQAFLCPSKALAETCQEMLPHSASSKPTPRIWVSSPALCPSSPQRAIHTKVLIPGGGLCWPLPRSLQQQLIGQTTSIGAGTVHRSDHPAFNSKHTFDPFSRLQILSATLLPRFLLLRNFGSFAKISPLCKSENLLLCTIKKTCQPRRCF